MSLKPALRDVAIYSSYALRISCGARHVGSRVVVMHEIADPARFRDRLAWLAEHFDVVAVRDLLATPTSARRRIAITFDDGYACWHERAAPVLEQLGLPATFFVCSGYVGLSGAQLERFCRDCLARNRTLRPLSRRQLEELASWPGFEIGGHTCSHVDFGRPWRREPLRREIADDRARLEDWTGRPVTLFAYPFGMLRQLSAAARAIVRECGYEAGFSMVPGFVEAAPDPFALPRDGLDVRAPRLLWKAWLDGAYDDLYRLKEKVLARS